MKERKKICAKKVCGGSYFRLLRITLKLSSIDHYQVKGIHAAILFNICISFFLLIFLFWFSFREERFKLDKDTWLLQYLEHGLRAFFIRMINKILDLTLQLKQAESKYFCLSYQLKTLTLMY